MPNTTTLKTGCCIAGGGPAGLMLGLLLARAGVAVTVLEKHQDFLRDFRGDTIHPSTLELMHELGLLQDFLRLPHTRIDAMRASVEGQTLELLSLKSLPTHCKFVAMMPQWDFLNFIAAQASQYPHFQRLMGTQAQHLLIENNTVVGVSAQSEELGALEIRAPLTVATDGRHSTLRDSAGLVPIELGVPIDVLWFRVPCAADATQTTLGRIHLGRIMVVLPRTGYYQCAWLIPKGTWATLQTGSLSAWKQTVAEVSPFLAQGLEQIRSWDDVKPLNVQINRLQRWHRPGFLCLGDAAHAMSPAGGVGVNMAVQDAVAAANLLWQALRAGAVPEHDLARVQKRRQRAVVFTQRIQANAHRRMFRTPVGQPFSLSRSERLALGLVAPLLRRLGARLIGLGLQPEHVQCPSLLPVPPPT